MKRLGPFKVGMLLLACLGMLLQTPLFAAAVPDGSAQQSTAGPVSTVVDVALRPGNVLVGQVVNADGKPLGKTPVSVRQGDWEVVRTVTNETGFFAVAGLRGGTYEISAGESRGVYRIWAPNTAPPSAQLGVLLTEGEQLVRGQDGPIGYWLQDHCVLAGLVALAVIIPVVLHNNRVNGEFSP